MIVQLAVRPVRLGIVFGDKALMGKLRPLPTHYLLEMHLSHAPHHVEMGFDEIFPSTGPRGALVIVTAGMGNPSGVFRTFDESGMCLLRGLFLGSLENSFP
jgi:hypothetical protein